MRRSFGAGFRRGQTGAGMARWRSMKNLLLPLLCCVILSGCGLVALPFRAAGDIIQVVPVVGKPIGAPIHAVGDAID
jgi:hypothetical protein